MDASYQSVLVEIRQFVAMHFGGDATQLQETTLREDVDGWDSVSFPGFLLAVEDAYQISLSPEAAVEIQSIGDLARMVHGALAARDG